MVDILFIVFFVPESIQPKKEKEDLSSSDALSPTSPRSVSEAFTWQSVDPLMSLRVIAKDPTVLQLAMVVFLSNLPEGNIKFNFETRQTLSSSKISCLDGDGPDSAQLKYLTVFRFCDEIAFIRSLAFARVSRSFEDSEHISTIAKT